MPYGDRTGPDGYGPMTGRRLGYCARYPEQVFAIGGFGGGRLARRAIIRGFGGGFGRGRRFAPGRYFWEDPDYEYIPERKLTAEEEKKLLEEELKKIEEEKKAMGKRLKELDK